MSSVLIHTGDEGVTLTGQAVKRLLERGILIRSCANYHGLGPDYYRVCVRLESDNQRLLAALQEVL